MSMIGTVVMPGQSSYTAGDAELCAFIAELLGWRYFKRRFDEWERLLPEDQCQYHMGLEAPPYDSDVALSWELVDWLNERGYLAVIKQLPRGRGFLLDEMSGARTDKDLPALVELDHVYEWGGREWRPMPRVSAEQMNIDVPFERYSYRPGYCCKTVPEALCKVVRALVERYPELREPVIAAAPQPGTEPAV